MVWNYWGNTRFAPVPCSRPVAGPHAGTVHMGPMAAKSAGLVPVMIMAAGPPFPKD